MTLTREQARQRAADRPWDDTTVKAITVSLALRASGATYQEIADRTNFSIGAIWKWIQRWTQEGVPNA